MQILELAEAVGFSPRRAYRFANLYRLLKASLSPAERRNFLSEDGNTGSYIPALIFLAIATGAPTACHRLLRLLENADEARGLKTLLNRVDVPTSETMSFAAGRAALEALSPELRTRAQLLSWARQVHRFSFEAEDWPSSAADTPPLAKPTSQGSSKPDRRLGGRGKRDAVTPVIPAERAAAKEMT